MSRKKQAALLAALLLLACLPAGCKKAAAPKPSGAVPPRSSFRQSSTSDKPTREESPIPLERGTINTRINHRE